MNALCKVSDTSINTGLTSVKRAMFSLLITIWSSWNVELSFLAWFLTDDNLCIETPSVYNAFNLLFSFPSPVINCRTINPNKTRNTTSSTWAVTQFLERPVINESYISLEVLHGSVNELFMFSMNMLLFYFSRSVTNADKDRFYF